MTSQPPSPVRAPPHILALLDRLHNLSSTQEAALGDYLASNQRTPDAPKVDFDDLMRDKFIALDKDKCEFIYQLIRAKGATRVVEAGTSFGVSTIYLALAVGQNSADGRVIATEKESSKAERAREHWRECGREVEGHVELKEGDLLETLKDVGEVDILLLDIWAPLALPTLKLVQPRMRPGAVVITDNSVSSADRYKDLLGYLRRPESPFTNLTLPYSNGLEMSVLVGTNRQV